MRNWPAATTLRAFVAQLVATAGDVAGGVACMRPASVASFCCDGLHAWLPVLLVAIACHGLRSLATLVAEKNATKGS